MERFLFYGAYPGAVPLARQPVRWSRYIRDSLIEPMISRDVLLLSRVDKLALLRRLFELGCVPADAVGAVVGAVGVLARGMAVARVGPAGSLAAGLVTPALLALAVRRMALRGEALFVIEVTAMRVDLLPAWINDIDGAAAPATWVYDVQLEGPRGVTDVYRRPRWCTYGGRDHRRMGSAGFHRPGRCPRPARRRNRGCPGCALRVDARPAAGRGAT